MDSRLCSIAEGVKASDRVVNIENAAFTYEKITKVCTSPNVLKCINWKDIETLNFIWNGVVRCVEAMV